MALIVQKYGGTSVGDVERIQALRDVSRYKSGPRCGGGSVRNVGETNRLMAMGTNRRGQTSAKGN